MGALPKVALLGRPNVGKSTLFNRLIRSNRAITHDMPGVTRDRMEGTVRRWGEEDFLLVDTGGVTLDGHARMQEGPEGLRGFEAQILEQARLALEESDLLCLVADGRDGLTPLDRHLADFLRKSGKPVLLVVNKVDGPERQDILLADFHSLGLPMLACSSAHGHNMIALEEELRERLFPASDEEDLSAEELAPLAGATRRQRKSLLKALRAERTRRPDLAADKDAPSVSEETAEADADNGFTGRDGRRRQASGLEEAAPPHVPGEAPGDASGDALGEAPGEVADDAFIVAPDDVSGDASGDAIGEASGEAIGEAAGEAFGEAPGDALGVTSGGGPGEAFGAVPGAEGAGAWSEPEDDAGRLRLALLGRPNAGKSSLVNALCGKERMIVSDLAGTTRDSVDVEVDIDGEPVTFVDTAGVRRKAKIINTVERYSVNSSIKSSTKAHVTLLVLDASEGLTQQDKRLVELLNERKTPFMLLINKSDLMEARQRNAAQKLYKEALAFCPHVPLLFVSALNRHNLKKIVPLARDIRRECGLRVSTGKLNRAMAEVLEKHQPPLVRRVRAKFFYLTQAESSPPTFVFFVNDAERVLPSYARYLEKSLRKLFGIRHAPMRVNFRSSHGKNKKR